MENCISFMITWSSSSALSYAFEKYRFSSTPKHNIYYRIHTISAQPVQERPSQKEGFFFYGKAFHKGWKRNVFWERPQNNRLNLQQLIYTHYIIQ